MRALVMMAMAAALAACSPGDTKKIAPETDPKPTDAMHDTFVHCTWGQVKSTALSVWSYACGPDGGDIALVPNGAGFDIALTGANAAPARPAVRVFEKAPDAPLDAILPAVRAASPGPATDTCAFTPSPAYDDTGKQRFMFAPTGAAKTAWDASVQSDAPGDPPCGAYGVSIVGDRYFEVLADHPATVIWVEAGSEIQPFDATTIKALAPGH